MAKKILLGSALVLVILTASFYLLMPEKVRIDFEKTRTIFKVYEDNKFVVSGIEYVRLFDGTKLMRAKNRTINFTISRDILGYKTVTERISSFKNEIIIEELYEFDNGVVNVENVPIAHDICFSNAKGKIFEYMIDKITYDGETKDILSPFLFDKNMKVEFQEDYYRAKVYNYKYASDKIKIRYRVIRDYQCFKVRLFDPVLFGINVTKICDWRADKKNTYGYVTHEYTCQTDYFEIDTVNKYATCLNRTFQWPSNSTWNYESLFGHRYDWGNKPNKTMYWDEWEVINTEDIQVCEKVTGFQSDNFKFNLSLCNLGDCQKIGKNFVCFYKRDRDSYVGCNLETKKCFKKVDSDEYVKLRDCIVKI